MAKITAELLRQMVGARAGQRPLIDKLVGPMNLVLPAYGITTELRISAFLGTAAPECDWFKTLREYGKGAGRAYGKPTGPYGLVYYGRGIFQNTWLRGYQAFTEYVAKNWNSIRPRAAVYKWTVPPDFVKDPELLADPYWAVEAACWYWKANGLAKYADRGVKGFFGLQGLVNRGSATKKALHYDARLRAYETIRRLLPDNFILNSAADSTSSGPSTRDTNLPSDPQVSTDLPANDPSPIKPSIFERLTDWTSKLNTVSGFRDSINPLTPSISPISGTSGVVTFITKLGGWATMLLGLFFNKWTFLFVGVALIVVAIAYLASAKKNAAKRSGGDAPVQQTNVAVETN